MFYFILHLDITADVFSRPLPLKVVQGKFERNVSLFQSMKFDKFTGNGLQIRTFINENIAQKIKFKDVNFEITLNADFL